MRLLFTGRGKAGSWIVRGEQLGRACGAMISQTPSVRDLQSVDRVVVVKRVSEELLASLRKAGTPWVYDILDCYPQPGCSAWGQKEAIGWVRHHLKKVAPSAVIWPNQRMRQDCDTGLPGIVLAHHFRPGIHRNPIRPEVQKIGYEGAVAYIGRWMPAILEECAKRGWTFEANPAHLADLDIVLAVRGGEWDNYATRNWKSNIKLANAHGSGTPFVGQMECGYVETASGAEYWAEEPSGLGMCFDWLTPQSTREQVSDRFFERAYPVESAARDLKVFVRGL